MKISKRLRYVVVALGVAAFPAGVSIQADQEPAKDSTAPIKKLEFQGAEIRQVVYFLADYGGVNVVVAPNVSGSVTISVKNVSWQEGLDIIGRTYDLAVVYEEKNYIRVLRAEDYREESRNDEKFKLERQTLSPMETRIVRIANSTAEDVAKAIKGLMTERGKVTPDPRTNSVVLQEVPDNITRVEEFIAQLDAPAKQIKISAQLVEVSSNYLSELGVKLGFTSTNASGNNTFINNGTSGVTPSLTAATRVEDPFVNYKLNVLGSGWNMEAVVQSIVGTGKGKIVAHPEITTIVNKEARIQMGQRVPIKQFDQSGNVTTTFEEVGTILRVMPHLTTDNRILMNLRPERSFAEITPAGVIINTNNAETNVVVENGQTAVIGGLTTEDEVESEVGVPVLKEIPLLGELFKYRKKTKQSRDLIIFVTPTLVAEGLATK